MATRSPSSAYCEGSTPAVCFCSSLKTKRSCSTPRSLTVSKKVERLIPPARATNCLAYCEWTDVPGTDVPGTEMFRTMFRGHTMFRARCSGDTMHDVPGTPCTMFRGQRCSGVFQLIYKQTVSTGTASSFIYLVVFVMKKRLLSLVASLGNMVRVTWSNNSRYACHKEWLLYQQDFGQ